MRIAFLDCFSGISGDMFLGAAVDAGVPLEKLQTVASALGINAELVSHRVERGGLSATKVDVLINGNVDLPREVFHEHSHAAQHEPSHGARSNAILTLTLTPTAIAACLRSERSSPAPPSALPRKTFALKAFEILAQAEAKIHNRPPESIHFHEVGSEDAIVDIVCSAVAIETLAADRLVLLCAQCRLRYGQVRSRYPARPRTGHRRASPRCARLFFRHPKGAAHPHRRRPPARPQRPL